MIKRIFQLASITICSFSFLGNTAIIPPSGKSSDFPCDTTKAKHTRALPLPDKVSPAVFYVEHDKPVDKPTVYPNNAIDKESRKEQIEQERKKKLEQEMIDHQ